LLVVAAGRQRRPLVLPATAVLAVMAAVAHHLLLVAKAFVLMGGLWFGVRRVLARNRAFRGV
jgi:hypothetical protein